MVSSRNATFKVRLKCYFIRTKAEYKLFPWMNLNEHIMKGKWKRGHFQAIRWKFPHFAQQFVNTHSCPNIRGPCWWCKFQGSITSQSECVWGRRGDSAFETSPQIILKPTDAWEFQIWRVSRKYRWISEHFRIQSLLHIPRTTNSS